MSKTLLCILISFIFLSVFKSSVSAQVPSPRTVESSNFVGAFYMPKNTSLTREYASLYKWNSEGGRGVTRWPLLGLHDGASPEVLDWQSKWALEHGISMFVFDWYWNPWASVPTWGNSIDAFLRSTNSQQMKFSLYFTDIHLIETGENTLDYNKSKQELLKIVDYWASNYFNKPNFLKIDGKPVVFIDFEASIENVVYPQILTDMRAQAQQHGYPGIYFVAMRPFNFTDTHWAGGVVDRMKSSTYDAFSSYGYSFDHGGYSCDDYAPQLRAFLDYMISKASQVNIKIIPSLSVFYDPSPMFSGGPGCNNPTPSAFGSALGESKNALDANPNTSLVVNGKKMILISSWNEWLEGSNIEPGTRLGSSSDLFSYLKAVRNVFAPAETFTSLTPTVSTGPQNPGQYGLSPSSTTSFKFTNQLDANKWVIQGGASHFSIVNGNFARSYVAPFYSSYNNKVVGNFIAWRGSNLNSSSLTQTTIKFKTRCGYNFDQPCTVGAGLLSWIHSQYTGPYYNDPLYSAYFITTPQQLPESSQYTLNLKSNPDWKGTVQEIRLRLNVDNPPMRIDLEEIAFSGIPGDANNDGQLTSADLACFLTNYWKTSSFSCSQVDQNSNSIVDILDFNYFTRGLNN